MMKSSEGCKPLYLLFHTVTVCSSCGKWRGKAEKSHCLGNLLHYWRENLNRNLCSLCYLIVLTVVTNYSALERQWEFLLKLEYIRETHKLQCIFLPLCGSEEFVMRRREKLRMMMATANESWNHVFLSRWCVTNGDVEQRNLSSQVLMYPNMGLASKRNLINVEMCSLKSVETHPLTVTFVKPSFAKCQTFIILIKLSDGPQTIAKS